MAGALAPKHKKEIWIMTDNKMFVGIDVGKFDVVVFCSASGLNFSVPNTAAGISILLKKLGDPLNQVVALEPTGGYEWAIWESLDVAGFDVRQVSAAHVRSFARALGALAKTDQIDARIIADFIAFRPDAGRRLPSIKVRQISVLAAKRRQLVGMRKRLKCQMKHRFSHNLDAMDDELHDLLSNQIGMLENQIQNHIEEDLLLTQKASVLRSIPGIGPVLCAALISDMPELGHISDKKIAALAGVAPINRDSGKLDGRGSIKGGRYFVRALLYQAALVASTHNPPLREFANRIRKQGKPHKVVLIAVARKLLAIANAMVAKNQLWQIS